MSAPDFSINRKAMVDSQLRTSGVTEAWLIAQMSAVSREAFVPAAAADVAYNDRQISLPGDRIMNPPLATALMLQQANVTASDNVLLIGGGLGYSAKLLASRAKRVVMVEEQAGLVAAATKNLAADANVTVEQGPLQGGSAGHGPYSVIIIDGAIAALPPAIADQLMDGGRIVTGLAQDGVTRIAAGIKHDGKVALRPFVDGSVGILAGFECAAEFVF